LAPLNTVNELLYLLYSFWQMCGEWSKIGHVGSRCLLEQSCEHNLRVIPGCLSSAPKNLGLKGSLRPREHPAPPWVAWRDAVADWNLRVNLSRRFQNRMDVGSANGTPT